MMPVSHPYRRGNVQVSSLLVVVLYPAGVEGSIGHEL